MLKKNLVKHQKVSKCYENDWSTQKSWMSRTICTSLVIRQKSKSQNEDNKKTENAKFSAKTNISYPSHFFSLPPFWDSAFCLITERFLSSSTMRLNLTKTNHYKTKQRKKIVNLTLKPFYASKNMKKKPFSVYKQTVTLNIEPSSSKWKMSTRFKNS